MNSEAAIKRQVDVGADILGRRIRETGAGTRYPAFSRVVARDKNGNEHVFWLVERSIGELTITRDITGGVAGVQVGGGALHDGIPVSKNAPFGLLLDRYSQRVGETLELTTAQQNAYGELTILASSHYTPYGLDAVNGGLRIVDDGFIEFESLQAHVKHLQSLLEEVEALSQKTTATNDVEELSAVLEEHRRSMDSFLAERKKRIRHIISGATLRNQPKLDEEQIRIKQSRLFDGHLIVDGGPGTGKTTTLIDRLNLLTDPAIALHGLNISTHVLERLANPATAYLLFTPNELLMYYLKEAMNAKGLVADSQKVKTWIGYREDLAAAFGILSADNERSRFLKDRRAFRENRKMFELPESVLADFLRTIDHRFIVFIANRHSNLQSVDPQATADPKAFARAQDLLERASRADSIGMVYQLFETMRAAYQDASKKAADKSKEELESLAFELQVTLRSDGDKYEALLSSIFETGAGDDESLESETDEEEFERNDASGPTTDLAADRRIQFNKLIRSLCRKLALKEGIQGVSLTRREHLLHQYAGARIDHAAIIRLAPKLFIGMLRDASAGPEKNVLGQVAGFYSQLRRKELQFIEPFLSQEGKELWKGYSRVSEKHIRPDELDLLVYFQLRLIREYRSAFGGRFEDSRHPILSAYRDEYREVVAIDEATDFTPLQLGSMSMMANPQFDCVTLSGDLMQRMTSDGMVSWNSFNSITDHLGAARAEHAALKLSYRQSARLLRVTRKLYSVTTRQEAPTRSPYEVSEFDPPPLLHRSSIYSTHSDWIARRIVEVRKRYEDAGPEGGRIPSIAILVPDEETIAPFSDALEDSLYLGVNVNVERCPDGKVLGSGSKVRVFNVAHIKGLEFEAAFFHDFGRTAELYPGLADKMLYVGLSRASLFLGITVSGNAPDILDAMREEFVEGSWGDIQDHQ